MSALLRRCAAITHFDLSYIQLTPRTPQLTPQQAFDTAGHGSSALQCSARRSNTLA